MAAIGTVTQNMPKHSYSDEHALGVDIMYYPPDRTNVQPNWQLGIGGLQRISVAFEYCVLRRATNMPKVKVTVVARYKSRGECEGDLTESCCKCITRQVAPNRNSDEDLNTVDQWSEQRIDTLSAGSGYFTEIFVFCHNAMSLYRMRKAFCSSQWSVLISGQITCIYKWVLVAR